MDIVAFKSEHMLAMDIQDAQADARQFFNPGHLAYLEELDSFTVLFDGQPAMCIGWFEVYPTRALVWAVLARSAGRHMTALTRFVRRLVDGLPHRRVEAEVDAEFAPGHRWLEMLGFQCETPISLRSYNAHGGDSCLYSKVK